MKVGREFYLKIAVEIIILVVIGLWTLSINSKLNAYETNEHADKTYLKKEVYEQDRDRNSSEHREIKERLDRLLNFYMNEKTNKR